MESSASQSAEQPRPSLIRSTERKTKINHQICRLCECPAVDSVVPLSSIDITKLNKWCTVHMGVELDELDVEKDVFCCFCVWEARFYQENCGQGDGKDLSWWPNSDSPEMALYSHFVDGNMKNCWIHLEQLADDGDEAAKEEKTYDCELCEDSSKSLIDFKSHVAVFHKMPEIPTNNNNVKFKVVPTENADEKRHEVSEDSAIVQRFGDKECNLCHQVFKKQDRLINHIVGFHKKVPIFK